MKFFEANFDGLVGPTHNYAGLSVGNVASLSNAKNSSSPRQAAKQGLSKMKALHDLGLVQGVLAPQERPDVYTLRRLGFSGSDAQVIANAAKQAPAVFRAVCSASSMWTANAATISPSADTGDGKIHFTPANLTNKFHRSLEPITTGKILQAMFRNPEYFAHHTHLPDNDHFGDEGAANHTRLCSAYGKRGVELFVFGRYAFDNSKPIPKRYPARHTLEACEAVARLHGLDDNHVVYMQQNPDVIDQGVFHNDVIAVGNQNVLFYHQQAFVDTQTKLAELQRGFSPDQPCPHYSAGSLCCKSRCQSFCRRLVCREHAGFKSASSVIGDLSDPEFCLVGGVRKFIWHTGRYLFLCGQTLFNGLVKTPDERIP
jgi:succinylarginine dihydrolase